MSKQLYEEALADVNKVKEIAEDNAKRAIIEAVTPRIRDLIERELLSESMDDDEMLNDDVVECPTLDLNAVAADPAGAEVASPQFGSKKPTEDEFELNAESVEAFEALAEDASVEFREELEKITESVARFKKASRMLRESKGYQNHITQMIANVENMYEYVQGSVVDPNQKSAYEAKLESLFQDLNQIQESAEMSKKNKQLNEEDVTLTLTGLPDDIDLDAIGVDLVTGEEDGEGEVDDLGLDAGDEDGDFGGDEGGDVDFDAMGGEETQFESLSLSDDTIVEIDENMLRTEIARMRKLREEATNGAAPKGNSMSADILSDFGGGEDEGDQFVDGEVRTEGVEEDEDVVDESTTSMTSSTRAMHEDDDCGDMPMEALERKLALETKLIMRAKARAQKIKEAMMVARSKKNLKQEGALRLDLSKTINRINETSERIAKVKGQIAEAKKASLNESRNNRGSKKPAGEAESLRTKLAESNLHNVKLRYANKLLQNESLTSKQKAQVIGQLDEAKTEREAKLVYDSLTKTLSPKTLREGADGKTVLGSSSRATRPASTPIITEGASTGMFDLDRWSKLAGIK